jgi:hypothetical protein
MCDRLCGLVVRVPDYRSIDPGLLRRVALLKTNVSKELSPSVIKVTRICGLGTSFQACQLLVTANVVLGSSILVTLMIEALGSSETSVLSRATRC